jgi:hypothetical protein
MIPQNRVSWVGVTRLDDVVLVGRAATSRSHMRAGGRRVLFYRLEKDTDGLSVMNRDLCEPQQICVVMEQRVRKCYGVITLQVGAIRRVTLADLDVVPDAEPDPMNTCDHAAITGLPFQSGEQADPALAEEIAIAIYENCRRGVWPPDPE